MRVMVNWHPSIISDQQMLVNGNIVLIVVAGAATPSSHCNL